MEPSSEQIREFMANLVWRRLEADLEAAVEQGHRLLEVATADEVRYIQGGIAQQRAVLQMPETYLEEAKEREEKVDGERTDTGN